ncbi:MAG: Smr/MutS family protein [Verrucomicrobiota bacterium]
MGDLSDFPEHNEPIEYPITEELDLHTFRPKEVPEVVLDYLELAREKNFRRVRIIHGKGIGTQREIVHRILGAHPNVVRFYLCDSSSGGWGATWAEFAESPSE